VGVACAHCGLPARVRPLAAGADRFCCYGCLLAFQVTRARGEPGAAAALLVRLGLAVFFAMNVMMVSMPAYAPWVYGADADGPLFVVLRVLALVLTVPVLALLGGPIAASAWRAGGASADALIVLGTAAAWALSVANVLHGRSEVYFDTAAMLLVLVTLGRWLEATAKAEAGAAVRATLAPSPAEATVLRPGRREIVVPSALTAGDVVEVGPGGAFPTDGMVLAGEGGVDESALTGESLPVVKAPGAAIAGGTCSVDGIFRVRVTARAAASAAARIAAMVDAARRERTAAERTADALARWLVPAVVVVTIATALWWSATAGVDRGVLAALAVLVVACPCGLGIATPVAVWTGVAAAARRGIIVRSAPVLERAATVDRVVFDKTGTLTERVPRVVAVDAVEAPSAADVLARAAAIEERLDHPVALAIGAAARAAGVRPAAATDVRALPGRGVRGRVGRERIVVGGERVCADELDEADRRRAPAGTIAVIGEGRLLGTLVLAERARPSARTAVAALRAAGVRVGLLSGDSHASALVPDVVPAADAALGLLPDEKVAHVRRLRAASSAIAMVGDGINDAPALAAADVGIAVGDATDLARMTADVVIVGADLGKVPWLLAHARRVRRVIRQNLAWAFGYNAVAVGLAATGRLSPVVASLAMLGSSLAVVANARRLAHPR
jgi:Cu2+-exporting ATPase